MVRPSTENAVSSRRAAFSADNVKGVHLKNMTLQTTLEGAIDYLLAVQNRTDTLQGWSVTSG